MNWLWIVGYAIGAILIIFIGGRTLKGDITLDGYATVGFALVWPLILPLAIVIYPLYKFYMWNRYARK